MSTNDVILFTLFGFIYLAVALTIGVTTYRKGRKVLFFIGFLMPALWLIGAIMPAKKGSTYEHQEEEHWQKESDYSHSAHHRSG